MKTIKAHERWVKNCFHKRTGADMVRLYQVSPTTITRTVAEARIRQEVEST